MYFWFNVINNEEKSLETNVTLTSLLSLLDINFHRNVRNSCNVEEYAERRERRGKD